MLLCYKENPVHNLVEGKEGTVVDNSAEAYLDPFPRWSFL